MIIKQKFNIFQHFLCFARYLGSVFNASVLPPCFKKLKRNVLHAVQHTTLMPDEKKEKFTFNFMLKLSQMQILTAKAGKR